MCIRDRPGPAAAPLRARTPLRSTPRRRACRGGAPAVDRVAELRPHACELRARARAHAARPTGRGDRGGTTRTSRIARSIEPLRVTHGAARVARAGVGGREWPG